MNEITSQGLTLTRFLANHPRLVVLTGAGISRESGIPTYRDENGSWQHDAPMTHQAFVGDEAARRRYWSRSFVGWPVMRDARPNAAHLALATLERRGAIELVITQNVDRLHQRAGSQAVVDLHGRLDQVRCLECSLLRPRETVQRTLEHLGYRGQAATPHPASLRPDGDVDGLPDTTPHLDTPRCEECRGVLMPDVVFFGGSVPGATVAACREALARADALLVVGSSLQVYSGFRFCRAAVAAGLPLALLNPGVTRADDMATYKWAVPAGPALWDAVNGFQADGDVRGARDVS